MVLYVDRLRLAVRAAVDGAGAEERASPVRTKDEDQGEEANETSHTHGGEVEYFLHSVLFL